MQGGGGRGRGRERQGRGGHVIVGGGGAGGAGATVLLGLLIGHGVARGSSSTRGCRLRGLGREDPRGRERLFAIRTCRMRTWTFVKPLQREEQTGQVGEELRLLKNRTNSSQ